MADLRLKTEKYTVAGREYTLACNMNVLADVQEANGGDLAGVLSQKRSLKTALELCAAMMNDCAEENGWPERFTGKSLGRQIAPKESAKFAEMVRELLYSALVDDESEENEKSDEEAKKNA